MSRFATALLVALGMTGMAHHPAAAAGKVVALVIGNESPDNGLSGTELTAKLKDLKDNLFRYGDESKIYEGANLSRDGLETRIRAFESGLSDAEVAIFYYVGLGAHSGDGDSFLVPQGWDGSKAADLVSIRALLERMRTSANGKGLVFLDAVQPKGSPGWRVPNLRPGLGSFSKEADAERLQIAFMDAVPGSSGSAGVLTGAMVKRLQPERIKLPQLASLLQQDVIVDTGGTHVPRLFGSMSGSLELQRLSAADFQTKTKKCLDERGQVAETTSEATARDNADTSPDEPLRVAAAGDVVVAGRSQPREPFWGWFCPEYVEPRERRIPQASRGVTGAQKEAASGPAKIRASYYGGSSPRGGGGGGHARAAASGVPTP